MAGKTGCQRGEMHVDAFGPTRHRRQFRHAELARGCENGVDARMRGRTHRRTDHIDERTLRFPRHVRRQRPLRERVQAVSETGGNGTHRDNSSRRTPLTFGPRSPTITTITSMADEISANTAGTPECFSSAATQKPTKIELSRLQLNTKPTARARMR